MFLTCNVMWCDARDDELIVIKLRVHINYKNNIHIDCYGNDWKVFRESWLILLLSCRIDCVVCWLVGRTWWNLKWNPWRLSQTIITWNCRRHSFFHSSSSLLKLSIRIFQDIERFFMRMMGWVIGNNWMPKVSVIYRFWDVFYWIVFSLKVFTFFY